MKLRIHGNSIRLRLNRREVAQFAAAGCLAETFEYGSDPASRLVYRIESSSNATAVSVRVANQAISIVLPEALTQDCTGTDRVGVSAEVPLSPDRRMTVLVEKEFRRLHGAAFDPDLYPNPLEAKTA